MIPIEALLNARRVAMEMAPLVSPKPELDVNPETESIFQEYTSVLDQQIFMLREESKQLMKGSRGAQHPTSDKALIGSGKCCPNLHSSRR